MLHRGHGQAFCFKHVSGLMSRISLLPSVRAVCSAEELMHVSTKLCGDTGTFKVSKRLEGHDGIQHHHTETFITASCLAHVCQGRLSRPEGTKACSLSRHSCIPSKLYPSRIPVVTAVSHQSCIPDHQQAEAEDIGACASLRVTHTHTHAQGSPKNQGQASNLCNRSSSTDLKWLSGPETGQRAES